MEKFTPSLEALIKEFSRFPGVGRKSAEKMAFFVLNSDKEHVERFSSILKEVKQRIKLCKDCFCLTERELCNFCEDKRRDRNIICVVENYKDAITIENTNEYRGLYHILMGHISPLEGISADDLTISRLMERVKDEDIAEIILATNPNVEGDATSLYIKKLFTDLNIKITRIARGIPLGGDLEFADIPTLAKSIISRELI